jgi:hypothetical protein
MARDGVERLVGVPPRTDPVGTVQEVRLEDRHDHQQQGRLHDPVANRGNSQRSLPAVGLRNVHSLHRLRPVALGTQLLAEFRQEALRTVRAIQDVVTRHLVHARCSVALKHQLPRGLQHVRPIHPVVQGVKPEARLLLGLAAQLPPQFREFRRQRHARFDLRLGRRGIGVGCRTIRSGLVQADLLTSCGNTSLAGSLRSTGVTRFQCYYGPLRLPAGPNGGYVFPPLVVGRSARTVRRPVGSPRFLTDLSASAVPNHPGEPGRCTCSLLHDRHGLHHFRKPGHSQRCHEVETGSRLRITADAFASRGFTRPDRSAGCPRRYMANEHLPCTGPLN